jgi:uncharacterized SAM-binding protein YcdF (DUF218 family)
VNPRSGRLWHSEDMTDATWAALMVCLTVVFALGTVWAFRKRGIASGLRGLAITLLPAAAWLTGTLEMFTEIAGSLADWATGLVLNPLVWAGIGLFGTSIVLFFLSSRLRARMLHAPGTARAGRSGSPHPDGGPPATIGRPTSPPATVDDDMADIEEMLRKRGIT